MFPFFERKHSRLMARSRAIKLMEVSVTGFHFIFTFGHFLQLWNLSSLSNEPEASQFAKQKGRFSNNGDSSWLIEIVGTFLKSFCSTDCRLDTSAAKQTTGPNWGGIFFSLSFSFSFELQLLHHHHLQQQQQKQQQVLEPSTSSLHRHHGSNWAANKNKEEEKNPKHPALIGWLSQHSPPQLSSQLSASVNVEVQVSCSISRLKKKKQRN